MAILLCLSSCDTPSSGDGDTSMTTQNDSESMGGAESETTSSTQAESTSATESEDTSESSTELDSELDTGKGAEDGHKRLYSDSGTQLNLVVEYWFEEGEDGKTSLHTDVMLESYSLSVTSRNNTQNYIKVGEQTQYFATDAINYDGKEQKYFKLGSFVFVIGEEAKKLPIEAAWSFNGTYNDQAISRLIIEDEIMIGETGAK